MLFIILDGVADRKCAELGGKTPLEAASTPSLDWFASNGKLGMIEHCGEKYIESDVAIENLFGYSSFLSRGQIEAIGAGIKLQQNDLALRANFATIKNLKDASIIDRRAGRTLTNKEAIVLTKTIAKKVRLPCKFVFKHTIQHRGVLVLRGGFSDNITFTDTRRGKLEYAEPLDDEESSRYSANIVNEFTEQSYVFLRRHQINKTREQKGLLPANIILLRDGGSEMKRIKKLEEEWLAVVYMPVEMGFAKLCGMKIASFAYPELKNYDVYANLYEGLSAAIGNAKTNIKRRLKKFDSFYIHFKEMDVAGHDGKAEEKKKMLELLDRSFFSFLKNVAEKEKLKIVLTCDHATVCETREHERDLLPILVYGEGKDETKRFTEQEAARGSMGKISSLDLMKKIK